MRYEVTVGNVGTVYTGDDKKKALKDYAAYVSISIKGTGRAGGESVYLLDDGELAQEFIGSNDDGDNDDK